MPCALLLEDDPRAGAVLARVAKKHGFRTCAAPTFEEAARMLNGELPDLTIVDLHDADLDVFAVMRDVRSHAPASPVAVAGNPTTECKSEAFRIGADEFLPRPIDPAAVERLLAGIAVEKGLARGRARRASPGAADELIGDAPAMVEARRLISRAAPTEVTVFITGETGCGKELVARAIHRQSRRSGEPFVALNCAALSPNLLESELFGHERGSFTGADRRHAGLFERASAGTLFLDEIIEMPLDLQSKLLRVLETGRFLRVGGDTEVATTARIVAASNIDPAAAIKNGRLREDLYYRLNVFPITLPPLRDRGDDIVHLAEHFLTDLNDAEGTRKAFAPECRETLRTYPWPGNVRELRNLIRRAYILADDQLTAECLFATPRCSIPTDAAGHHLLVPIGANLAAVERQVILATLESCGGHRRRASDLLGISPKTLYNRLRSYRGQATADVEGIAAEPDESE